MSDLKTDIQLGFTSTNSTITLLNQPKTFVARKVCKPMSQGPNRINLLTEKENSTDLDFRRIKLHITNLKIGRNGFDRVIENMLFCMRKKLSKRIIWWEMKEDMLF